ncbi:MAG: hypothetical protein M1840_001478 [Geoglossum simile]|nr:MAG: hypothetical protein M1840_001478 [Geoglossum simile]
MRRARSGQLTDAGIPIDLQTAREFNTEIPDKILEHLHMKRSHSTNPPRDGSASSSSSTLVNRTNPQSAVRMSLLYSGRSENIRKRLMPLRTRSRLWIIERSNLIKSISSVLCLDMQNQTVSRLTDVVAKILVIRDGLVYSIELSQKSRR